MPKRQKTPLTVGNVGHPNSRKTQRLFKNHAKTAARQKSKMVTAVKQNIIGEKLLWFKERIPPNVKVCSKSTVDELLKLYMSRFDEEMEQIEIKHSIGQRGRQHASRQDLIRHTQQQEKREYNTCGIEMPNLLDETQVKILREWTGELRFLTNFKLVRLGKKHLQESSGVMESSKLSGNKDSEEITNDIISNESSESSEDDEMVE